MLPSSRSRSQPRAGMDYLDTRRKRHFAGKIFTAAFLTVVCIFILKHSPGFSGTSVFSHHEQGVTHVLVTGGAGYIGSHASLRLLKDSYRVTIVDNLSRGNIGAIKILQELFPEPGRLQFIFADLGDAKVVGQIFAQNAFDAVMHFAAVAYVGESTLEPLRCLLLENSFCVEIEHSSTSGAESGASTSAITSHGTQCRDDVAYSGWPPNGIRHPYRIINPSLEEDHYL